MKKQGHVLVAAVIGVFAALSLALTTDQILHRVYDAANTALRVNVVAGGGGGGGGAPTGAAGGDLGGTYPNPTLKDCAANEILQRNAGDTAWECAALAGGGGITSGTSTIASGLDTAICYDAAGVVKCDATSPLWDATTRTLLITTPAEADVFFKSSDLTGTDNGGNFVLQGAATVDGQGGTFLLHGGSASGSGDGGAGALTGGDSTTGNGGIVMLYGGYALGGTGNGGDALVASGGTTGGAAGDITFRIGDTDAWTIDGTTGNFASVGAGRSVTAARFLASPATAPAVSDTSAASCGTTAATLVGTDAVGKVTVGATAGTSCTVTFTSPWTNAPICVVNNETTANLARATSTTTTTILAGTFVAGDVLAYICAGYAS